MSDTDIFCPNQPLQALAQRCQQCRWCGRAGGAHCFATGDATSPLWIVAPAPTQYGAILPPAELNFLADSLALTGIPFDKVYLTTLVKCQHRRRPQPPLQLEMEVCLPWLRAQAKALQPQLLICLGDLTAQRIIREDIAVATHHGQWFQRSTLLFLPTHHPADVLEHPTLRLAMFEDMQSLAQKCRQLKLQFPFSK